MEGGIYTLCFVAVLAFGFEFGAYMDGLAVYNTATTTQMTGL
jgi:hypothetical protein